MSLRLRLTLFYTGLLAAALLLFSVLLYGVVQVAFLRSVDQSLEKVAGRAALYFRDGEGPTRLDRIGDRWTFVQVRTEESLISSSGNVSGLFPLPTEAHNGLPVFSSLVDSQGEPYRLYTVPILDQNRPIYYVQVASGLRMQSDVPRLLFAPLAVGVLLFVAFGALGGWWVARKAIAPINSVATAARAIGESADLSLRVPYEGPEDEVGLLVQTFNGMLDQLQVLYGRLAAAVDAQQRFVADASHELRTPLTIIRGNIDYLQRAQSLDPESLADMASEAERMTRLVEELLTMARADTGQAVSVTPFYLGPLVREVCRKVTRMPHEASFTADLPEALDRIAVMGHAEWLTRALLILIDNAFKYTPTGSVTVRAGRQGDGVVVQVNDTGIGITSEDLPYIFERFYRADRARGRGGVGLGLAIARWVVGIHGGRLTAESELGKGSTFSLWLPIDKTGRDAV